MWHMQAPGKDARFANRGKVLEEYIELANRQYRAKRLALIHKVPTAWLPIRDNDGRIISAKVEEKAAVDFMGAYRGIAIAFDAKECSGRRIRWDRVEPHQMEFLEDWDRGGGIAFVFVGFTASNQHFVIPWERWRAGWAGSRTGGPASLALAELEDLPEYAVRASMRAVLDYLEAVDRLWLNRLEGKAG